MKCVELLGRWAMLNKEMIMSKGKPLPLGVTTINNGVNFAVVSTEDLSLCIFDESDLDNPLSEIRLDPSKYRTGDVLHIFVENIPENALYAYRNRNKGYLLLDPYAKGIVSSTEWGKFFLGRKKCAVLGEIFVDDDFDWEGDWRPDIAMKDLIIYEMHVRGFSACSDGKNQGGFMGVVDNISYLKNLGINAIELLPIFEFDELECKDIRGKEDLFNYWGYSTVNFFSPCNRYCSSGNFRNSRKEFKTLVRELHKNGIEVILDVVFNHTAEGNELGPKISFKGLANSSYYMLDFRGKYLNFSGCGNTFNVNHQMVSQLIIDALHYWVIEMHVDGFRFDLASIFYRDKDGWPLEDPPLIRRIEEDPILSTTKLIAEPWDCGGMYKVGNFGNSSRWMEWNGRYRDCIRKFIKGSPGNAGEFASRISGSEDLYLRSFRKPFHSINFVTCHDGFSLMDLVSYNEKHNETNGENNCDGCSDNDSWNCGVEGLTDDRDVQNLRIRQMKNFMVALMISQGVPMISMGDEYCHTKFGNNNTWCHDDENNWLLWDKLKKDNDFFKFLSSLIDFRKSNSLFRKESFLNEKDIQWHGLLPNNPSWNCESKFVAFSLHDQKKYNIIYVAFNASHDDLEIELPFCKNCWEIVVDTYLPPSSNFLFSQKACVKKSFYTIKRYSSIILQNSNLSKEHRLH